jgi:hypothetical protein
MQQQAAAVVGGVGGIEVDDLIDVVQLWVATAVVRDGSLTLVDLVNAGEQWVDADLDVAGDSVATCLLEDNPMSLQDDELIDEVDVGDLDGIHGSGVGIVEVSDISCKRRCGEGGWAA